MSRETQLYTDMGGPILGDCWRTSLACIMDLARDTVPHFVHEHPEEGPAWWHATVAWVEENTSDMTLVSVGPEFPVYVNPEASPRHVILTGPSPRGNWLHCVVGDAITGEVVWDPHPSRAGLAGPVTEVAVLVHR